MAEKRLRGVFRFGVFSLVSMFVRTVCRRRFPVAERPV